LDQVISIVWPSSVYSDALC